MLLIKRLKKIRRRMLKSQSLRVIHILLRRKLSATIALKRDILRTITSGSMTKAKKRSTEEAKAISR